MPLVCNFALVKIFGAPQNLRRLVDFKPLNLRGTLLFAKAKSSKSFCAPRARFCKITFFGCLESVREEGFYFWDKQKVAKAFFGASHEFFN